MKKLLWNYCKLLGSLGLIVGFALGFLYGIGGFFHDLLLTEINRGTYLALNALWGMPLIFGCIGLCLGVLIALVQGAMQKIKH